MNHFDHREAAGWYAGGRPYFHPKVIHRVQSFLGLDEKVPAALDVACGTGQSTAALKEVAEYITAADASREMLSKAPEDPRVRYVEAPAENLPLDDASFDLATVALALHWLDRDRFLRETHRVLRPSGWLVVYDNGFTGKMKESPGFERWYREEWQRYPSPPRDRTPVTEDQARRHGFRLAGRQEYSNEATFSLPELADYLMSQSNVISAIREGRERPEPLRERLKTSLSGLFREPEETFEFSGYIVYLQRRL